MIAIETPCRECAGPIPESMRSDAVFCSKRCRMKNGKRRRRGPGRRGISRECLECSTPFIAYDYRNKYCKMVCQQIAYSRAVRWAVGLSRECRGCGGSFTVNSSVHKYCTPVCMRKARRLRSKYGITPALMAEMLERQGGCAICHRVEPSSAGWQVDHNHDCCPGQKSCGACVRGILCFPCNVGMGNLQDSPELLWSAIAYLADSNKSGQPGSSYAPRTERIEQPERVQS